jgi:hypothetical protein
MYVSDRSLSSLAATIAAAAFLFAATLLAPVRTDAEPHAGLRPTGHDDPIPRDDPQPSGTVPEHVPVFRAATEPGDEIAVLDAVDIALTQAGDGSTYYWRRGNGRLAGAVRPTSTFRDADRRICRHIEMELRLGTYKRRTEGIACRGADGVWLLEG